MVIGHCSRRMTGLACPVGVDVAALQQIVEASDAIPAISVGFEDEPVLAPLNGPAMVFRQQVDQELGGLSGKANCKRDLPRFRIEIVYRHSCTKGRRSSAGSPLRPPPVCSGHLISDKG